ncbi:MAG: hypothetical protein QMB51_03820, partial [Patescibacteria group bacterium]
MKNILKVLFVCVFATTIISSNVVKASECNICVYDMGGCVLDDTTNNPANYGTTCGCSNGLMCARTGVTQNCSCQKPLGSGLLSVADKGSLSTNTSVPQIVGNVIKVILGVSG